ncbi:MAG: HypC/HybG/HupF family hydrogenase formation chaperone [Candidatus Bathyarchaeia archaeon]
MCLAVPGKVLKVEGSKGKVDFGDGVLRDVDLTLVEVVEGDYVLVHAGFAIQVLKEEDALKTLEIWKEILELEKGDEVGDL